MLINKSERIEKKKAWSIGAVALCAVLAAVLCMFPVENAFVTFDSPMDAYSYNNNGEIVLVVEGETTTKVVAKKKDYFTHAVVPKTEKGWKISMAFDEKEVGTYLLDDLQIMVTRYKDTDEYYLNIMGIGGKYLELSDARGTKFFSSEGTENEQFTIYHAYVKSFDENYTLTVNGKSICIEKDMKKILED